MQQANVVNASAVLGLFGSSGGGYGGALMSSTSMPPPPMPELTAGHARTRERVPALDTRVGNLYSAFWRMLEAAVASMQDVRTLGPALAESAPMRTFTEITAPIPARHPREPAASGLEGMSAAFAQLAPPAQNMLLALVDVNLRLTAQEAQLHQAMSSAYALAAQQATACVTRAMQSAVARDAAQASRMEALHASAVQSLLGTKYAWLVTKTVHVLRQLAAFGIDAATPAEAPTGDASALLHQLQGAKRALSVALEMQGGPTQHGAIISGGAAAAVTTSAAAAEAALADTRLGVRMERHALATRKAAEIARLRHDPYELARVLRYFAAADEELNVALASATEASERSHSRHDHASDRVSGAARTPAVPSGVDESVAPAADERRGELAAMFAVVSDLVDQAHVVAAEAHHLRSAIERQVRDELAADLQAARAATMRCLTQLQHDLARAQSETLASHASAVAAAASAERTLASELAQCSGGAPLQVCLRAVSDAAQTQRHHRDACALQQHKTELHALALALTDVLRD